MINKFWLSILNIKPKTKESNLLDLKMFVDLDTLGWYALSHHDPKDFLVLVAQKEPNIMILSGDRVRWSWAIINENEMEEVSDLVSEAKPITLIEVYGV
jgi:hypothetical protein